MTANDPIDPQVVGAWSPSGRAKVDEDGLIAFAVAVAEMRPGGDLTGLGALAGGIDGGDLVVIDRSVSETGVGVGSGRDAGRESG